MFKPSYGVVTAVIVVLAVIAFLSRASIGLIPPGPTNSLAGEPSEFLQQAAHEQIDWKPLSEGVFSEARRLDRPIMLVVGSACSWAGRKFDADVFTAPEIRGYLARNFICVRVDAMLFPEYANAFLPVSRGLKIDQARLGIPPDLQVWFLDPKGQLYSSVAYVAAGEPLDPVVFLGALVDAANRYDRLATEPVQMGEIQRHDLRAISGPLPQELPNLAQYALDLGLACPPGGGIPNRGFQRLWPEAWRFQLLAGRWDDYRRSIAPCLESPLSDVLDGGFFTCARSLDWRAIEYDKLAIENAGMLRTLALAAVLMKDPVSRRLANRAFDCLAGPFVKGGLIAAGQIGETAGLDRSPRYSFSPRELRDLLPNEADRQWTRDHLGLRVETNPQMTPLLESLDLPARDPADYERIVGALGAHRPAPSFAGFQQLDVGGYCVARMLEAARLLGDQERSIRAATLFDQLDAFRTQDVVIHSLAPGTKPHVYLGDYLAYADAALQYFLATGNGDALDHGVAVLRRGLFLFAAKDRGVFTLSQPPSTALAPRDATAPEIVDNRRESCTAMLIRLCSDYGRLLGAKAADLRVTGSDALTRFAEIGPALGPYGGGYACAALKSTQPQFAVVVGVDAVREATALAALLPGRLVTPAAGAAPRPGRAAGVYIVGGGATRGPLTPSQAVAQWSARP